MEVRCDFNLGLTMLNIELFSDTTKNISFMFLDQFFFELLCENKETQKHGNTETHTDAHTDSDMYSIVLLRFAKAQL